MRVLFWGTPEAGLPALRALAEEGHELIGAVTQPDRPAGRGRKLQAPPVKRKAESMGVPVLQPEKPRGEEFLAALRALDPEISVVAAYGHILTEDVLELPPRGSLNVHASLLPRLRGAAPVNWAIIRGHETSGVTIMRMVLELDAGPIVHQIPIPISPGMTAGDLAELTSQAGAEAIVEALAMLEAGTAVEREQDHALATYAPKLDREDAHLDWSRPADEVERWIRGCDPWPAAWSRLGETRVQLFEPRVEEWADEAEPGVVLKADPKHGVLVAAGEGAVRPGSVKPAGRGRMTGASWVRGRGVSVGDRFD